MWADRVNISNCLGSKIKLRLLGNTIGSIGIVINEWASIAYLALLITDILVRRPLVAIDIGTCRD